MLVLSRKMHEQVYIQLGGETVIVRIVDVGRDRVRLGIEAPRSVIIHREEVARRIAEADLETDLHGMLVPEVAGV